MGGDDDGCPRAVAFIEQVHNSFGGGCIKIAGGFVDQDQGRGVGDGPGQGHSLLFTTGQFAGDGVVFVGKVELLQQVHDPFADDLRFFIGHFHGDGDVLGGGSVGEEFEVLVGYADFLP